MRAHSVTAYKRPTTFGEAPEPEVGDHDVLVEVHAAGVNVLDVKIRDGAFKTFLPYKPPFVLGHDLAGVVTQVGREVAGFAVGDEVIGRPCDHRIGTFAERIAVHQDDLAPKPGSLSMTEAASVPLVALTAWQALVELADVQPGQKVLVHAGSGGVGVWAIQLAKHLGATVATTAGTSNLDWVRQLGADVVVDYKTQDFTDVVHDYDVVLDTQGGETLARSLGVLKPGGMVIGITGPPDPAFAKRLGLAPPLRLAIALLSLKTRRAAKHRGVRYAFLFMRADGAQLARLGELIDAGTLRPVVDRTYPFDQAAEALTHVEGGRSKGKVVVEIR
jgi:NADPH:quinone reductase-like Zn-dependent oxidoreductase